jgi:hypothetical protein
MIAAPPPPAEAPKIFAKSFDVLGFADIFLVAGIRWQGGARPSRSKDQ